MFTFYLITNSFLSENGKRDFSFDISSSSVFLLKRMMVSSVYCSRTITAFEIKRLGFRFQLHLTLGCVSIEASHSHLTIIVWCLCFSSVNERQEVLSLL